MDYESFVEQFQKKLRSLLPEGTEIQRKEVLKNNGVVKDALVVSYSDSKAAPTLYFDDLYRMIEEGHDLSEITESTAMHLDECREYAPAITSFSEESARENLYCAVIGKQENEQLLSNVPHEVMEDLAVVARYKVGDTGSFLVDDAACRAFQMTPEEVLEAAHMNTNGQEITCRPMGEVIREIMLQEGMPEYYIDEMVDSQMQDCPLWVMSNGQRDGAAVITSPKAMNSAHEKLGEDYYVLPSSRHEVILIPESKAPDVEYLKDMVRGVNSTALEKTDKLSDSVYHYDGRKLSKVDSEAKAKEVIKDTMAKAMPKSHKR